MFVKFNLKQDSLVLILEELYSISLKNKEIIFILNYSCR